jgi:hypothetical protein
MGILCGLSESFTGGEYWTMAFFPSSQIALNFSVLSLSSVISEFYQMQ